MARNKLSTVWMPINPKKWYKNDKFPPEESEQMKKRTEKTKKKTKK